MKDKCIGQILLETTDGLVGTVTDLVLTHIFFSLYLFGATRTYEIYRAQEAAQHLVEYDINYQTIKRALYRLTRNGFVKRSGKHANGTLDLTSRGKKYLDIFLPTYHTNRPWNGYLHLISYDIPKNANHSRDLLREYLKRISCALLQESLWLTPYTPSKSLSEFIKTYAIKGRILISKLGRNGSIGDEKLSDLITRVYHLDYLQNQYQKFINKYSRTSSESQSIKGAMEYLAILKKDPQLPFPLEPKGFSAQKAYVLYKKLHHSDGK
jgi:DNA-binding transcriptional regulator PaaX